MGKRDSEKAATSIENKLVDLLTKVVAKSGNPDLSTGLRGDRHINEAEAFSVILGFEEFPDKEKLKMSNGSYVILWTNRVAIWWFFRKFVEPFMKADPAIAERLSRRLGESFDDFKKFNINNPFDIYGERAFAMVLEAWRPMMQGLVKKYVIRTRGGKALADEFMSQSHLAFLHILEKQAMSILGMSSKAQSIPFAKRLERSIQTNLRKEIAHSREVVKISVQQAFDENHSGSIKTVSFEDLTERRSIQDC